jgi:hypothetical protein
MAFRKLLALFISGGSSEKRRVDLHKRMQLIPEPRWPLSPSSAYCNRRPTAQPEPMFSEKRLLEAQHASEMTPQRSTLISITMYATRTGALVGVHCEP